ncbi:MAG TPA: penicillin-binding transpeptidase domain-containing protein, partial [Gemmatimonas sp.]|uniref:penicillin-binding transpeptidase domain-containing protein n=1 Tax=Gemmatimonas sp. TaxID=1962908 RepID=UPI002EDA69E3
MTHYPLDAEPRHGGGTTHMGHESATPAQEPFPVSRGRSAFVHVTLVLFAAAIVARAAQIQLVERESWQRIAERQHVKDLAVAPPRGAILEATGNVLVETREQMKLVIEPHNLTMVKRKGKDGKTRTVDTRAVVRRGLRELRVSDANMRRVFNNPKARWVELPYRFLPADLDRFKGLPGVKTLPVLTRVNATPDGLRGIVGALNPDGAPLGGIELELDPFLRGEAGHTPVVLDGRGGRIGSPMLAPVEARPGHTVTLTINQSLQEIAEQALTDARKRTGASGGDVVILDPRDGAILALAGVRDGKAALTSTPLAEPYEPGSVMKPFVVSRLLDAGRAKPDELLNTENGTWAVAGRTLSDEHKAASMSVRDIIRFSSNIGTAKLALRFNQQEEYQALRDFGFGNFTGVPYPAESRGRLALPKDWGKMTPASVAIGYEMMATPVQIATAYAALANDGELLQPVLVREVRDSEGRVVFQHRKRAIRQVVTPATAALMRTMLKSVVDSGTARAANLATFDVAGKSGTARRLVPGQGYVPGRYNASFAGMFPAEDPQYVIVARLIDPEGTYFGGIVSGAMANMILQNALATRDASLDRGALARVARPIPVAPVKPLSPEAVRIAARDSARRDSLKAPPPPKAEPLPGPARVVVDLPFDAQRASVRREDGDGELQLVPSVYGLDAREAVRVLYAAGFQVSVTRGGEARYGDARDTDVRTRPATGTALRSGSTVQLEVPRFASSVRVLTTPAVNVSGAKGEVASDEETRKDAATNTPDSRTDSRTAVKPVAKPTGKSTAKP